MYFWLRAELSEIDVDGTQEWLAPGRNVLTISVNHNAKVDDQHIIQES